MLPPAPKDVGRLSDVLASALASVGADSQNFLQLPSVRHSLVIFVDGLGSENLQSAGGHARFLNSRPRTSLRCEFPSTTATSISGFATGKRSNEHGVIGYSVFNRSLAIGQNLLTGWKSRSDAAVFKKVECLAEKSNSIKVRVLGPSAYQDSGFTELTMANAEYTCADAIDDRFRFAEDLVRVQNSLTYLYVPELDQLAHKHGVKSSQWLDALESIDARIGNLVDQLPVGVGVLVTADHGVIDVSSRDQVLLDEFRWYSQMVLHTAGDPRCNFVYLNNLEDLQNLRSALEEEFGAVAYICSVEDLKISGWADWTSADLFEIVPDLVIIWRENLVGYDRRLSKPQHLKMIGQHGGISDAETRIPLIKLGSY